VKRRVVRSDEVRSDYLAIIRHIADENPDAAEHVAARIDHAGTALADFATGRLGRVTGAHEIIAHPEGSETVAILHHSDQEVELNFQSSAYNNDSSNRVKYFPALPAELRTNKAVHWLVRRLYQAIPSGTLRKILWLGVGLHISRSPAMTPNPHPLAAPPQRLRHHAPVSKSQT
jgi:toxin ParE1/3/4